MLSETQRLKKALNRETVDRPPCICPGGMMNMITKGVMEAANVFWPDAHTNPNLLAQLSMAAHDTDCFENYGVPFCMTVEVENMGAKVDLGDMTHEPRVSEYVINSVSGCYDLPPMDCRKGRAAIVLEAIDLLKSKANNVPVIGNLTGPISVASSLMEPTIFYKELRKKKQDAHNFLDFVSDQLLKFGLEQLRAGADVIAISDPSGTGEILGPAMFAEYTVPAINKITQGLRKEFPEAGLIVHICGQMRSVFKPLNDVDCQAVSFDAEVSLRNAKENLQEKAIMGNVSTFALEFANPDKIADMTKLCVKNGADIIAPACGMGTCSPLENVQAILAALKNYSRNKMEM